MNNLSHKRIITIREEYLPEKLIIKFNEFNDYDYRTKNNFLQCLSIIFHYQITEGYGMTNYIPLGSAYWKKVFGGNYHEKVLLPLLEQSIIECLDYGYRTFPFAHQQPSIAKGQVGIRYRINPLLIDDNFQTIQYLNGGNRSARERIVIGELIETKITNLKNINIDQERANEWVESNAENICNGFLNLNYCEALPENISIECNECLNDTYNVYYKTVRTARFYALTKGLDFFHFRDKFYIGNIDEFINKKTLVLKYHYKHQISIINIQPIEEKRNPVTLRLYSNLTNFPSKILPFIHINNCSTVQLDLKTSQFLIFANLINVYITKGEEFLLSLFKQKVTTNYLKRLIKILNQHKNLLPTVGVDITDSRSGQYSSSDVNKFIAEVFFDDFYSLVQKELKLPQRLLAKQLLFKLLFKKSIGKDVFQTKLTDRYPIVMNIISSFKVVEKKKAINNQKTKKVNPLEIDLQQSNFSVFLQCVEAEIFIDNILNTLRVENIPCFTRHDSIVVAYGYEDKAEEIAKSVFQQFGFRYNHKSEDLLWDVADEDELEASGYMQWVMDENVLNDEYQLVQEAEGIDNVNDINNEVNIDEAETITKGDYLDGIHIDICQRLSEIGILASYFEHLNAEFLEELSTLPFMSQHQRNILLNDAMNLNHDMRFLQKETEEILRYLVERIEIMNL